MSVWAPAPDSERPLIGVMQAVCTSITSDAPSCAWSYAQSLDEREDTLKELIETLFAEVTTPWVPASEFEAVHRQGARDLARRLIVELCGSLSIDPNRYEVPW